VARLKVLRQRLTLEGKRNTGMSQDEVERKSRQLDKRGTHSSPWMAEPAEEVVPEVDAARRASEHEGVRTWQRGTARSSWEEDYGKKERIRRLESGPDVVLARMLPGASAGCLQDSGVRTRTIRRVLQARESKSVRHYTRMMPATSGAVCRANHGSRSQRNAAKSRPRVARCSCAGRK
jgi:hypothetical protein